MKLHHNLSLILFTLSLNSWASVGVLPDVKVEISGNLKLKEEFNVTKLDPLYFLGGFKKIEVTEFGENKTEIKVLFANDVFKENELSDPEQLLKNELNNLSALPHELSSKLNSKDKEADCIGERKAFTQTKINPDYAFESLRASLTSFATFHLLSLKEKDLSKEEISAQFTNVRQNIESQMDKIFGTEKKPSSQVEGLFKRYGINKKDLDTREALLKSFELFDEAQKQLQNAPQKNAQKMTPRLSVEKEGLAYIITIEKI